MSSSEAHEAEQAAITARYDNLTKIGDLAHELGAEIEICEDIDEALSFCAERQDQMDVGQLRIFDEARMDANEDALEDDDDEEHPLNWARGLVLEHFKIIRESDDAKKAKDCLAANEYAGLHVKAYNELAESDEPIDKALSEMLFEKAPSLFDYDEEGNYIGEVKNENGITLM